MTRRALSAFTFVVECSGERRELTWYATSERAALAMATAWASARGFTVSPA